jgi:hypothetical protein
MKVTFSRLTDDLKKMYPNLSGNMVFQKLEILTNLRMFKDQGLDVDVLQKDWIAYVENEAALTKASVLPEAKQVEVSDVVKAKDVVPMKPQPVIGAKMPFKPVETKKRLEE